MTNEIQAWTDADLAYRAVMLKAAAGLILDEFEAVKALAAEQFQKGDSKAARQGDLKLGRLTMSDPKPKATVTDRAKFEAYLEVKFADTAVHDVMLGDASEVCAALADAGRDDLFTIAHRIPDWKREERLKAALAGESVPGVTVATPDGVMSAKPEQAAKNLVRELLNGSAVPLLAIEGGQA